jgi:hypothetical protein
MNRDKFLVFNKHIEANNTEFEQANPNRKRVMLAEDVLQRIALGQMIPTNYTGVAIFDFYDGNGDIDYDQQCTINDQINDRKRVSIKKTLDTGIQCKVCAKGGLFVSYIARVNKMTWASWENDTTHTTASMKKLRQIFSEKQLAMIEGAYEGDVLIDKDVNGRKMFTDDEETIISVFRNEYNNDPIQTLHAICENIIENNGTFVLEGVSQSYPK